MTNRDDDRECPTEPAPPPESSGWPPKLADDPSIAAVGAQLKRDVDAMLGQLTTPARDDERWQEAGIRATESHATPNAEPFRGSLHVNEAGEVVPGDFVPARDWIDYGKDTGPRLRIKSLDASPVPEHAPPDPNGPDPGDIREAHEAYKRAQAEGDDAAIAKLFPDVLDELHSKHPGAPPIPELDWSELEPALLAEWREWGRSHAVRGRLIAVRHVGNNAEALIPLDLGDPYHVTSEERTIRMAWKEAKGDPRKAASLLVLGATKEIHRVRAAELFKA